MIHRRRNRRPGGCLLEREHLLAHLNQDRRSRPDRAQLQLDALGILVPLWGMAHAGEIVHGIAKPVMIDKSLDAVPQRDGALQGIGGELPAVAVAGGDGQDFKLALVVHLRGFKVDAMLLSISFIDCPFRI